MCLGKRKDRLGNVGSRLVAAGSETGPVVKVDDADCAIGVNDTVAAIDDNVQFLSCPRTDAFQLVQVDVDTLGMAVNFLPSILAVSLIERIEPIEELRVLDTIEFHQITHQMHINHSTGDATVEVFLKDLLSLLLVTDVAHVLLVHGMEIAALDPATLEASFLELFFDVLVGVHSLIVMNV